VTTYSFPGVTPQRSTWTLLTNSKRFTSPFTGAIQTVQRTGERWHIRLEFSALSDDDRAEMLAFVTKLNGGEHRFTVHDHSYVRRGSGGGTPLVAGASQTGNSLDIDGASTSVTNWLRAGDMISFGNELKMVTAAVNTDVTGAATIPIIPKIRTSPADNSAVDITAPILGKFILMDRQVSWTNEPRFSQTTNSTMSSLVIEAVEDVLG